MKKMHHRHHYHQHPALPQTSVSIAIVIALVAIHAPTTRGADNSLYTNCSSTIQCGNLTNIGYPFWGLNRASSCGLASQFELTCLDNATTYINISSQPYRVLRVDNESHTMTVARDDYWGTICPTDLHNATQGIVAPFSYTSDTLTSNLTLYYGCQLSPTVSQLPPLILTSQFNCSVGSSTGTSYFLTSHASDISTFGSLNLSTLLSYFGACSTSIVLASNVTAVQSIERSPTVSTVISAVGQGFGLQWTDDNCSKCLSSGGQCGRDLSSGDFLCYCRDRTNSDTCSSTGPSWKKRITAIFSVVALLISLIICTMAFWCLKIRNWSAFTWKTLFFKSEPNLDVEIFMKINSSLVPTRYKYGDVKRMTNSFSEKLGQGGFGSVYKGKLRDSRLVAVKILIKSKATAEEFINEVISIGRASHINVVTLLGFCYEGDKRALIFEYMPNGSLDKFRSSQQGLNSSATLECKTLYQIALGIARGLEYLHRGCNTRILHFDIKPQNILLDVDFTPKISDFGLAKLCQGRESTVSILGMRGTIGFIAPEVIYRNIGRVSHKSDVYSYGMLILEMVGLKDNSDVDTCTGSEMYFPDWIYTQLESNDNLRLPDIAMEEELDAMLVKKMILVSLWCIQTNPSDRPSISKVIEMLEGKFELLQIPPKPLLYSLVGPSSKLSEMPSIESKDSNDQGAEDELLKSRGEKQ